MNGKGSTPRNLSRKFRDNFDTIDWKKTSSKPKKPLSPEAERAKLRPKNFFELPGREQWDIDKNLGILDWDGS